MTRRIFRSISHGGNVGLYCIAEKALTRCYILRINKTPQFLFGGYCIQKVELEINENNKIF